VNFIVNPLTDRGFVQARTRELERLRSEREELRREAAREGEVRVHG
jgi:hypothetical protein